MPPRPRTSPDSPAFTSRRNALSNLGRLLSFTPSKRTRAFSDPTTSTSLIEQDAASNFRTFPPCKDIEQPRAAGMKRIRSQVSSDNETDTEQHVPDLNHPQLTILRTAAMQSCNIESQKLLGSPYEACRAPPPESHGSSPTHSDSQLQQMRQHLSRQISHLHASHEAQQNLIHETLREQARATALLESRLDMLQAQTLHARTNSSTFTLIWTVMDALSYVLLCILALFIARPYSLFKKLMPPYRKAVSQDLGLRKCRQSWRLSTGDHLDDPFFSGAAMRISISGATPED